MNDDVGESFVRIVGLLVQIGALICLGIIATVLTIQTFYPILLQAIVAAMHTGG